MQNHGSVKISIQAKDIKTTQDAQLIAYSSKDALKKALITYLISLAMAIICIFIPLIHFFAPPGLLLFGPFLAFVVFKSFYGQEDIIVKDARCPACQGNLDLARTKSLWPLREVCQKCGANCTASLEE